jgi:hypothetical protein
MRHRASCTIAAAFLCAFQAVPAQAQSRVFVAAQGSDNNPCSFALPCRTFQHAHDVVVAGGEIDVLDPAGYGTVTISKAISIQGHGFAGISTGNNGGGILVFAGANDAVSVNGLLIDGAGIGNSGIFLNTGRSLTVENCLIRNFAVAGIAFDPSALDQARRHRHTGYRYRPRRDRIEPVRVRNDQRVFQQSAGLQYRS